MLPWQFAQFALLTQTAAVFALYMLEFIGSWKVSSLVYLLINKLRVNCIDPSFQVLFVLDAFTFFCIKLNDKRLVLQDLKYYKVIGCILSEKVRTKI